MKKSLFATTAIVAAAAAASMAPQQAAAQDDGGINLGVGGYYEFYYTASTQDDLPGAGDERADRVRQEGEIEFSGDTTLDNGIQVGVNVQLEAYTTGDQIDEHYAFVEGSFGRMQIGAENSAPYAMGYIAPSVGINANSPDYLPFNRATGIFPSTVIGVPLGGGSGDAPKLTYFTPRMAGFQLGASYAPDTANTGGATQGFGLLQDDNAGVDQGRMFGVGANYVNSFNGIDLAVSAGYETVEDDDSTAGVPVSALFNLTNAQFNALGLSPTTTIGGSGVNDNEDYESYGAGLNVGYAGFTVGGSINQSDDDGRDALAWDLGVSYETGPWGASVTWLQTRVDFDNVSAEPVQDTAVASLTYQLGTGIALNGNLHYFAEDQDVQGGYDGDGYGASAGLMLNF
ncbi:MAG: porin [Rhodovibrio sp.]|nr:porin [Rhodovibrio sp.]